MSNEIRDRLHENLQSIRQRVTDACQRSGRSADAITLVAVTKYAEMAWVQELVNLGVMDMGEARPQQLVARANQLPLEICWHLIGHLQRNKAEDVLPVARLIHSVDSVRLFEHIAKLGKNYPHQPAVLLEINVSGEASKDGFKIEELMAALPKLLTSDSIDVQGLMTMAPLNDDAETARPVFRQLRELRDKLKTEAGDRWPMHHLSMGMSGDFEIGIEEGATIVRIGSSLFEGLGANEP